MTTRTDTARYDFRCDSCGTAIPKGTQYQVLTAAISNGDTESQSLCNDCARGHYGAAMPRVGFTTTRSHKMTIRNGYDYDAQRWTSAGLPADYGKVSKDLARKVIRGQITPEEAAALLTQYRQDNS